MDSSEAMFATEMTASSMTAASAEVLGAGDFSAAKASSTKAFGGVASAEAILGVVPAAEGVKAAGAGGFR